MKTLKQSVAFRVLLAGLTAAAVSSAALAADDQPAASAAKPAAAAIHKAAVNQAAEVAKAVEALRVAMVAGDEKALNALVSDHLSYGHSSALVQDKKAFVAPLIGPQAPGKFVSITLSKQTVDVAGKTAVVRHVFDAINQPPTGAQTTAHISVLQVWVLAHNKWTLLARQAVALPPLAPAPAPASAPAETK